MAILGVLLGITMTVLGYLAYRFHCNAKAYVEIHKNLTERVEFLEKRKAVVAEAVAGQTKPAGVGTVKLRTWNEDAAEAVTR